jgi:predicted nucleic acid-binding protein
MTRRRGPLAGRTLTLDAGALVALDRNDRTQWSRLRVAQRAGVVPVVPAPVVTQVWRSPRQANLGRALDLCAVEPVDEPLAREAGLLCAATGSRDAVDAIVVASAARHGGIVVTSDPQDIAQLAQHVTGVAIAVA